MGLESRVLAGGLQVYGLKALFDVLGWLQVWGLRIIFEGFGVWLVFGVSGNSRTGRIPRSTGMTPWSSLLGAQRVQVFRQHILV